MPIKFKEYTVHILMIVGLVFLGIGCAGKNGASPLPGQNTSSEAFSLAGSQDIFLRGSDTVLPLAQAEAEEFMNENPEKRVTVTGSGTGVGIAALIDGEVDIATASREMKTDEIKAVQAKGINPVKYTIAYDGIAYVDNNVKVLSLDKGNSSISLSAENILSGAYHFPDLSTFIPKGNLQVLQRNSSIL